MDLTKLTKQEQAVVIGKSMIMVGQVLISERIDKKKFESATPIFNAMEDNTTPKVKKEADVSLINKLIDDLLKSKRKQ